MEIQVQCTIALLGYKTFMEKAMFHSSAVFPGFLDGILVCGYWKAIKFCGGVDTETYCCVHTQPPPLLRQGKAV